MEWSKIQFWREIMHFSIRCESRFNFEYVILELWRVSFMLSADSRINIKGQFSLEEFYFRQDINNSVTYSRFCMWCSYHFLEKIGLM
jgi:hypothetical protein